MKNKFFRKPIIYSLISVVALLGIIIYTYFYIQYEKPQFVSKTLIGVKFSGEDLSVLEPIEIKIEGVYTKKHSEPNTFKGTIFIGDIVIDYDDRFENYAERGLNILAINMGIGDSKPKYDINKEDLVFTMYIEENLNNIAVQFYNEIERTEYSISRVATGEVISAPCDNREDGIRVFDKLYTKHYNLPRGTMIDSAKQASSSN